jgi:hypothetical protein
MTIILPALAVAFAAFCLWLAVRIYNRRELWAKRTAVGVCVALVYPLSFGPACWFCSRLGIWADKIPVVYRPMVAALSIEDGHWPNLKFLQSHAQELPGFIHPLPATQNSLIARYAGIGAEDGWYWYCVFRFGPDGELIHDWVFAPPNTSF